MSRVIRSIFFCYLLFHGLLMPARCQPLVQRSTQEPFKYQEKIDALVDSYLQSKKFQAASIGIVLDGKTWTLHFGQLAPENSAPPDDHTIYEIGSITKVMTSLLLADAVLNSDDIKLDSTLAELIPELGQTNPQLANSITLLQLATHTSGLPRMPDNIAPANPRDPYAGYDRKLLIDFLSDCELTSDTGSKHAYSNLGAGLLGDVLSQHSGETYQTLLQNRILKPLEMSETSTNGVGDRENQLAPPFNSALLPELSWHFEALTGAGSVRSTTSDMLKFILANLNPPDNEVGRVIEYAWQPQLPAGDDHRAMALGWMIAGDGSTRWHNGQTGGYQSMLLVSRELEAGVILLCNTADSETNALAESIFQTIVGMNIEPRKFDETVEVESETIKRLVGSYHLAPNLEIQVTANESRLMVQLTGQTALRVYPESDTVWNYHDVNAKLEFSLPESGPATKVTLFQNGLTMPAPRIEE